MSQLVMAPDQFHNCPICKQPCQVFDHNNGFWYINLPCMQNPCQVFLCLNRLAEGATHYYAHIVEKSVPRRIAFQEFSVTIGNKLILFGNMLNLQMCMIKTDTDSAPLQFDFCIEPDFPDLSLLSKKLRTCITFS